jgi:MFS family permease
MVFTPLHIPYTPLALELLNILVGIITAILLYLLLYKVIKRKNVALAGTALFVFLPAPLWYCGIAYVSTAIMLPVAIIMLWLWNAFENNSDEVNARNLLWLSLCGIVLCYIDWLAVFLLAAMALWALVSARKHTRYMLVAIVAIISMVAGVFIVLMQFAAYLGWEQVLHYWKDRFAYRSMDTSENSADMLLLFILRNLLTGFLPLFLLAPFVWKKQFFTSNKHLPKWPLWALAVVIPYNFVFFNWSANHEFAWLAFGLFAVITASIYLLPFVRSLRKIILATVAISLVMYFVINLPGPATIRGDRYAHQKELGEWIRQHVDPSATVFSNLVNDKIVEYYSKRTFNEAQTAEDAAARAKTNDIKKAVWLNIENGKVITVLPLFPAAAN